MKALGEAALELAWLPPCAASLVALTGSHLDSIWKQVRHDPGCVLHLLRGRDGADSPGSGAPAHWVRDPVVLTSAQEQLRVSQLPLMDWHRPGLYRLVEIAGRQARLAAELAVHVPQCDPERAWIGGLLAPMGWLVVGALDPARLPEDLARLVLQTDAAPWQHQHWGLDATALTRRLARAWRLPSWLAPILGHLGLHASIVERLGAEPRLFQTVQLAVAAVQRRTGGLQLPIGASVEELLDALNLSPVLLDSLGERAEQATPPAPVDSTLMSPAILDELLRLGADQRRHADALERLQLEVDQLQGALEHHSSDERGRLQTKKLTALAELAAGAGHEINNPLAVISGQAQYLLKQIEAAEEQLVEDPSPTLYLDTLKAKLHKSLKTIVGQAHRIHHVLTDLMQFARPAPARPQTTPAARLVHDAVVACQPLANERQVQLVCPAAAAGLAISGDLAQMRVSLTNLVRNAVEAAGPDGWAGVRVEADGAVVRFIVEDSGPGPAPAQREHLFDPFYSGRSAGRGRGLGLPTAWRLAQQNGGEVIFAGATNDATRFVLTLPSAPEPTAATGSNGNGHHHGERPVRMRPAIVSESA